jgi:ketosteroid isomerase-like protein
MKRTLVAITIAVMTFSLAACSDKTKTSPRPMVQEQLDMFLVEWSERDPDGASELFAIEGVRVVSGDQLPAAGREQIKRSLAKGMGDSSPHDGTTLEASIAQAREYPGGIIVADGRFTVTDADGKQVMTGKWGNVHRMVNGRMEVIMESAHAEDDPDADPARFTKVSDLRPMPSKTDHTNATPHAKAVDDCVASYSRGFNSRDGRIIAETFTTDGIQLVGSAKKPNRGRAAIMKAANEGFAGNPESSGQTLVAVPIRIQQINDDLLVVNGVWEVRNDQGDMVKFGQWGNLLEIQPDGSALMVMESAGAYHNAE